jgi:tRNA modification GTPase
LKQVHADQLTGESAVTINLRHRDCLRRARESCVCAREALAQNVEPEYVALDLDEALRPLGEILGNVDSEQMLDAVFSQFCIGK